MERAVAELFDRVRRPPERVRRAVGELTGHLDVRDAGEALGGDTEDPVLLELVAVRRLGHRPALRCATRHTETHEHREQRLVRLLRRTPAPVLEVAGRAVRRVEERAEAVEVRDRRRRRHPAPIEDRVAEEEVVATAAVQVRERPRERVSGRIEDGRIAAGAGIVDRQHVGIGIDAGCSERGSEHDGEESEPPRAERTPRTTTPCVLLRFHVLFRLSLPPAPFDITCRHEGDAAQSVSLGSSSLNSTPSF